MKNLKRVVYMATFTIVFVALVIPNVLALTPVFAVSDYNLNETVAISSTQNFAIARVYNDNKSDCNFTVHAVWIPDDSNDGIVVTVPEPIFLEIDTSQKVYVDVEAKKVGNYSGVVQFSIKGDWLLEDVGVSKVVGGGSAKISVSVVDASLPPTEDDVIEGSIVDDSTPPQDDGLLQDDSSPHDDTLPQDDVQPESLVIEQPQEDIHNKKQKLDIGVGLMIVLPVPIAYSMVWFKRRRRKNEY